MSQINRTISKQYARIGKIRSMNNEIDLTDKSLENFIGMTEETNQTQLK